MELSRWEFGLYMLVFGMGLTLGTLYLLTWIMRALTAAFKPEQNENNP